MVGVSGVLRGGAGEEWGGFFEVSFFFFFFLEGLGRIGEGLLEEEYTCGCV